jgi:hypothetical protein
MAESIFYSIQATIQSCIQLVKFNRYTLQEISFCHLSLP